MDYFLPKEKTHMMPIPDLFPIDPNSWKACIRGTGNEPQSFTCGRNVGQSLVELLSAPQWVLYKLRKPVQELDLLTLLGTTHLCHFRLENFQRVC
jgi:hypothetical protein